MGRLSLCAPVGTHLVVLVPRKGAGDQFFFVTGRKVADGHTARALPRPRPFRGVRTHGRGPTPWLRGSASDCGRRSSNPTASGRSSRPSRTTSRTSAPSGRGTRRVGGRARAPRTTARGWLGPASPLLRYERDPIFPPRAPAGLGAGRRSSPSHPGSNPAGGTVGREIFIQTSRRDTC